MARSADILTYIGNSTSNKAISLGLPLLGGVTLAGGGYCHAIVRVKDGHVAEVRYSGETNATLARDAYCAPIERGGHLRYGVTTAPMRWRSCRRASGSPAAIRYLRRALATASFWIM
jgi:hypothetical protein